MRAKVIKNGRIIDVFKTQFDGYEQHYSDIETNEDYLEKHLDFNDLVDWEQRKYEIAKDVLCAIKFHEDVGLYGGDKEEMSKYAVDLADALIEELKKGNNLK